MLQSQACLSSILTEQPTTLQLRIQAQTKHGSLKFDNDAPSSFWGKRGEINFE